MVYTVACASFDLAQITLGELQYPLRDADSALALLRGLGREREAVWYDALLFDTLDPEAGAPWCAATLSLPTPDAGYNGPRARARSSGGEA